MKSPDQPPRRTEADLRAALTALERHAPAADTVLQAVRERTGRPGQPGRTTTRRAARSWRWPRLAVGVAVVAVVATVTGLAIALLPGRPPAAGGGARASRGGQPATTVGGGLPSAASLGRAMFTAFSAANDDILYSTQTGTNRGVVGDIYQDWAWPAQPVTGQPERWREQFSQRIRATAPLLLTEDDSFGYLTPPASANYVRGLLTVVCYAGTGQTGCGYGPTETPPGTWSQTYGRFVNPNPGLNDLRPAALAAEITQGKWRVVRRTRMDGQPAIELAETPAGSWRPLPTRLWVNARTHLPLRMVTGAGAPVVTQLDWRFLPPTPANLSRLRVPIPPGYPRSSGRS